MPKRDPERAEYERRFRKEEEEADLRAFINAYEHATCPGVGWLDL